MKLLERHVALHVLGGTAMVLAVLLGLFAIALFAEEIGDAPKHYQLLNVLAYVALRVPSMLVQNAGFGLLIGCLVGLGVLASQSELTVMRASGVSIMRIVWMVLRPTLVLILLLGLLGEYVVPPLDRLAQRWRTESIAENVPFDLLSDRGNALWMRQGNDFLHFNHITPQGDIYGFARIAFDDERNLRFAQYALQARHGENAGQPGWQLESMRLTRFDKHTVGTTLTYDEDFWPSDLDPGLLGVVAAEPTGMSLAELRYYIEYLASHEQDNRGFELVFWQKATQPLAIIGLVLVAISFIFGPLRDTTMGYRLFTGIMVGIFFRFSQDLLGPTSMVYGFAPLLAVMIPILFCWILGIVLLSRTR